MADCVPVKFSLRGKISGDVFVLGSWDGWSQATKLDKSDETLDNSTRLNLPCGYHEYKFKIGDHWIHDNTKPTVVNKFRTLNNFVNVMKPPDIAISDTSDQPEITVDFNPILQATEEPLPLIPKLYEAAPKENQDDDDDFKEETHEGIQIKLEPQIEHVVDMPETSLLDLEPVSSIGIRPFGSGQQSVEEAPEPWTSVTPTSDGTIDAVTAKVQTGEEVATPSLQVADEIVKETEQVKDTVDVPVVESPEETSIKVSLVEDEHGNAKVDNIEAPETTALQVSDETVKETERVKDTVDVPITESTDKKSAKVSLAEDEHGAAEVENVETPSEPDKSNSDAQNIAERVSDKTVHQEEIAADEDKVKLQKEIENAAVHDATKIEGGSIKTERRLQQEIADYLSKENDNVPEEIATKETVDHRDNVSNAVQDTIEKVADDKIAPQEEHPIDSVEQDASEVPDENTDETKPLEKTHTAQETTEYVGGNEDKTPISNITVDSETGAEVVPHKTEKYDHEVIQEIPESKKDLVSDEVTKVFEEMTLQEEEKAPILPQSEPVVEIIQPVLQEEQPEETALGTLDKNTDEALPQQETHIKTEVCGPEKKAIQPVIEKKSQDEISIEAEPNVQDKVAQTVSKETEKHDNVIQDIPEIKEDTTTDEAPPQPKEVETDKEQEKEATSLDKGSDKTDLQQGNQKLDETAPPKEAANHVETMVDDVVKEITQTAIQEAGKDVRRISPQLETEESAAMQDLEEKTQEKLTKDPAKHEVPKEAEVEVIPQTICQGEKADMALSETEPKKQRDVSEPKKVKDVEDVTDKVKGPAKEAALPEVDTKADLNDFNMTGALTEKIQVTGDDERPCAVDIESTTQNTEVEVTPSRVDTKGALTDKMEALTEILHEKEKDEKPVVVDVGKATQLEPDAPTYVPDITNLDASVKTTIETKSQQEDEGGLDSMHEGEALPEDETTKDVVSNLEKEVEKPSTKAPAQEKMPDTVVIEKVEKEKDKALGESPQKVDKAMKEADKIIPVDDGKSVQDREGLGDIETSPTKEIAEHVIFDKPVSDEYNDTIEEKTSVGVSEEQKSDKTEVPIKTKPVEEATSKVLLGADIKPQEGIAANKHVTEVQEEPSNLIQAEDKPEKHEPPSEVTKISKELEDVKLTKSTKESKDLPMTGGSELPMHLSTEKPEKPLTPGSKEETKKKEDTKSRLSFWKKKDKTSAEQKSTPEQKPTKEELQTEKKDKPQTPIIPSKEEAKKKEGPTSRLSFLKKKKKEEPTVEKQTEKSKPETTKPSPEEPTTKTEKAKTRDDDTKPQGFLGILRCCRCF